MKSLFIDTHDTEIVLALYEDSFLKDKEIKVSVRHHSDYTMPMLKELLSRNHLNVNDLNEIIVINGPGSFTGVRLGVTIAKTLAYTLNITIKTITSLEMYAVSNSSNKTKIPVIHDVKGAYAGIFTRDNQLEGELFYKSNEEFDQFIKEKHYEENIIKTNEINFQKVYEYMKNVEPIHPHKVNPIYIKIIEALKND